MKNNHVNKFIFVLLASILLVTACVPNSNLWGYSFDSVPTATQTLFSTQTATLTPLPTATTVAPAFIPTLAMTPEETRAIQHVVIVSFDGLRPDAIERAPMDSLLKLMQTGAYTMTAQTVFPSTTLPAHSSMLVGVCVARHHVIWDEYIPENGYARGTDLFDIAHAAGLRTVMIVGKEKLRQITEPESTDVFEVFDFADFKSPEDKIIPRAIQEVRNGFGLMFIHMPSGDLVGHEEGWMSRPQLSAYHAGDVELGPLLDALDLSSTLIIVTSDHGGHDTTHGSKAPEDMTIPWIISGPGIKPMQLTAPVQTMDTAATAAYALGLSIPEEWQGVPVLEAFGLPVPVREFEGCQ